MLSLILVIFLVRTTKTKELSTYILAGIIISSLADAGIMMLKYVADPLGELASIEFWTMGSLASITLDKVLLSLLLGIVPFILLCLAHHRIVILSLGDENAKYLGLNAKGQRIVILLLNNMVNCLGNCNYWSDFICWFNSPAYHIFVFKKTYRMFLYC